MFDLDRSQRRVHKVFAELIERYVRSGGDLKEIIYFLSPEENITCDENGVGIDSGLTLGQYLELLEVKECRHIREGHSRRVCNIDDILKLIKDEHGNFLEQMMESLDQGDSDGVREYEGFTAMTDRVLKLIRRYKPSEGRIDHLRTG